MYFAAFVTLALAMQHSAQMPVTASAPSERRAMWIELAAKPLPKHDIVAADTLLNARAIARRKAHRTMPRLFDERDLPIDATRLDSIRSTGADIRTQSR